MFEHNLSEIESEFISFKNQHFQYRTLNEEQCINAEQISSEQKKHYKETGKIHIESPTFQMSVVIMAGGLSARYYHEQPKELAFPKLYYRIQQIIDFMIKKQWRVVLYVVCSPRNIERFYEDLQKKSTDKIRIYLCKQHELPLLDDFGMMTIYSQFNQKLMYSSGIGNILESTIQFGPNEIKTIYEHMDEEKTQLVYCFGCSNAAERGIDLIMLGYFLERSDLDMIFKCAQPQMMNVPRVLKKKNKWMKQYQWEVIQFQNAASQKIKSSFENFKALQQSKAWMNNFVFKFEKLREFVEKKKSISGQYQFLRRKITNEKAQSLECVIAQKKLSSVFMNENFKCFGYVQEKHQYVPIVTAEDTKTADQRCQFSSFRKISHPIAKKKSLMKSKTVDLLSPSAVNKK